MADPVLIPDDARSHYSERVAHPPHCYQADVSSQPVAATSLQRRACSGATRIVFAERTNRDADLSRHRLADPPHYGAHTTAGDALRAGLPVLTCLGESFASRVAASRCRAVGLDELVSTGVAGYEATALALAARA